MPQRFNKPDLSPVQPTEEQDILLQKMCIVSVADLCHKKEQNSFYSKLNHTLNLYMETKTITKSALDISMKFIEKYNLKPKLERYKFIRDCKIGVCQDEENSDDEFLEDEQEHITTVQSKKICDFTNQEIPWNVYYLILSNGKNMSREGIELKLKHKPKL
jgi:hypothetical protein